MIDEYFKKQIDYIKEQDEKYPDSRKIIHKEPCVHCPSMRGGDPESDEIATYPKEVIAKEYLFVCAWRTSKLCKGLCDNMGIDQTYLDNFYNGQEIKD